MKDLFFAGGLLFMSILSLLLIILVAWTLFHLLVLLGRKDEPSEGLKIRIDAIKGIGLFSMITGILGQLIGIYMALSVIEKAGDISPAIVFSGLKVSMITTLYGIIIYLVAILLWFGLQFLLSRRLK